jgi:hypothetical protein
MSSSDHDEWNNPGFGWANLVKSFESIDIIPTGFNSSNTPDFSSDMPIEFLLAYLKSTQMLPASFDRASFIRELSSTIRTSVESYFMNRDGGMYIDQYHEFMATSRSNDKILSWELMIVKPDKVFSMHAHPNIEFIFVASGSFYEYRYEVSSPHIYNIIQLADSVSIHFREFR